MGQSNYYKMPWKRSKSINDIPTSYYGSKGPWLRGRVVSVSDGDTIRFYHVPTRFSSTTIPNDKTTKISDITLPIRVCTIDTPETAKFGNEGQAYGNEAKELLKQLINQKIVWIQLLQKDQYQRCVAEVTYPKPILFGLLGSRWLFIDEVMLKVGLAEVYIGSGAVYGHQGKDKYIQYETMGGWHPF